MKNKLCISLLLILLLTAIAVCQNAEPIRIWSDGASYKFYQESSVSYMEIWCAIQRSDLQFEEFEGKYWAKAFLYLEIQDESHKTIDSLSEWMPVYVDTLEDAFIKDFRLFHVLADTVQPGKYHIRLTVVDDNSKRSGISTFELEVKDYSKNKFSISDLQLAYDIKVASSETFKSKLVKNNRYVLPNPNGYFSNEDSLYYIYAELYNLDPNESKKEQYSLKITILDEFGYEIRSLPEIKRDNPGGSAVVTESFSLVGLTGGKYFLNLDVKDLATGEKSSSKKPFKLIYSFDQLSPTMVSADVFTEEDAKLMESVIYYITSKDEKNQYRQLSLEGKKNFLERFWDSKNPIPGSKLNSFKDEIFRRYIYANHYFSTTLLDRTDGWKSDRGRVYITYGEPDEVERNPSSIGNKPFTRWYYIRLDGQRGNDHFVFIDEDGYGNYRLVHSTCRGEISNPDWATRYEIQDDFSEY